MQQHNAYSHIPLAYIEWYSKLRNPERNSGMYKLQQLDPIEGIIVPLTNIRQGCMLFPNFGSGQVESSWQSKNVLDKCKTFYINNWQSKYTYQTLY